MNLEGTILEVIHQPQGGTIPVETILQAQGETILILETIPQPQGGIMLGITLQPQGGTFHSPQGETQGHTRHHQDGKSGRTIGGSTSRTAEIVEVSPAKVERGAMHMTNSVTIVKR